jgi:tRNA A37 threonylcarbamoyladenosine dehydratase
MNRSSRFDRLELLIGASALARLAQSAVTVFGVGGVGSFAAEGLARSGIGRITLVDHDLVEFSNINRQTQALDETVGKPKVEMMADRCRSINPAASVRALQVRYAADTADRLLDPAADYILDCIDQVTAKLHLIQACRESNLPIISSMGAANKLDPAGIRVADICETHKCGLARIMRRELRRRGITEGVKVVYSTESPRTPFSAKVMEDTEAAAVRRAPLGSSSFIPPLFGMTMAGTVIRALLDKENP